MKNNPVRNNENCNVKRCNLNTSQKIILRELLKCKEGHRVQSLEKLTKIKQRTVYDNLKKLSIKEFVENIYPIWRLCRSQGNYEIVANLIKDFEFQLHDLSFILRLIKKPDWWDKRENKIVCFDNFESSEVMWGNNPYSQLKNKNHVIQLFSNTIIVILRRKYFGNDPFDCFLQGVEDFLNILDYIEQKFRFKFLIEGIPQVSIKSQHYVKINDIIAQKCKKVGKGFEVVINACLLDAQPVCDVFCAGPVKPLMCKYECSGIHDFFLAFGLALVGKGHGVNNFPGFYDRIKQCL